MVRYPRVPINPSAGGGVHFPLAEKSIRLARYGCTNRPFYHIVVNMKKRHQHVQPIEQLGTFDPLPNMHNEVLVSLNIERLRYWLSHNTTVSKPVSVLLGLSGLLPVHPLTYMNAWRNRAKALKFEEELREEKKSASSGDGHSANCDENKSGNAEENKSENSDANTETPS